MTRSLSTFQPLGSPVPVEPRKRCTFYFECRDSLGPAPLTLFPNGVGFRPEGRGFLSVLAPTPDRDPPSNDFEVDHYLFEERIWPTLAEHIPAFEAIRLVSSYACHYDFNTLDENAIVGKLPSVDNGFIATGFSGHGLQQSPAIGRALAELITTGRFETLDLTRFGYTRVVEGRPLPEVNCY